MTRLAVTLTVEELRELVREELRLLLAEPEASPPANAKQIRAAVRRRFRAMGHDR